MSERALAAAICPKRYGSSTMGVKKSTDCRSRPPLNGTYPASSRVSIPLTKPSAAAGASPFSTCSRSPGANLEAQPAFCEYFVSLMRVFSFTGRLYPSPPFGTGPPPPDSLKPPFRAHWPRRKLLAACRLVGGTTRLHDAPLLLFGTRVGGAVGGEDPLEEISLYSDHGEAGILEVAEIKAVAKRVNRSLSGGHPGVGYTAAADALHRRKLVVGRAGGGPDPLGVAGGVPGAHEGEVFAALLDNDHVRERAAVVQDGRVRRGLFGYDFQDSAFLQVLAAIHERVVLSDTRHAEEQRPRAVLEKHHDNPERRDEEDPGMELT